MSACTRITKEISLIYKIDRVMIVKALMINVKAQLMERDAIFVQLLANYLKCNAIELLR